MAHLIRLSQEPCLGVWTYSKRPGRVEFIELLEQRDELRATMTVCHIGKDMPRMQINSGQYRHNAMSTIFMVAPNS
jgi:hypothetical protein